jgi:hypothetical protein
MISAPHGASHMLCLHPATIRGDMNIPVFYWCQNFGFANVNKSTWMARLVQLEEQIDSAMTYVKPPQSGLSTDARLGLTPSAIFVAPEYLFRPQEYGMTTAVVTARSLPEEEKEEIVRALCAISERYPSLLLFGGTIVWHKALDKVSSEKIGQALAQWNPPGTVVREQNKHGIEQDVTYYDCFDPSQLMQQEAQRRQRKYPDRITAWHQRRKDFKSKEERLFLESSQVANVVGYDQQQKVTQKKQALGSLQLRYLVKNTCFVC